MISTTKTGNILSTTFQILTSTSSETWASVHSSMLNIKTTNNLLTSTSSISETSMQTSSTQASEKTPLTPESKTLSTISYTENIILISTTKTTNILSKTAQILTSNSSETWRPEQSSMPSIKTTNTLITFISSGSGTSVQASSFLASEIISITSKTEIFSTISYTENIILISITKTKIFYQQQLQN